MNLYRYRAHAGKLLLLGFWVACILSIYWFLDASQIPLRELPQVIKNEVDEAGFWGPWMILLSYAVITIIPFPTTVLAFVAGTIYGPFYGSLLVLICMNAASIISFYLGRFFGRHLLHEHEHGWIKKYDELMQENGFMAVVIMRSLFVPFDIVSIASGMSKISFRQYMLGSVLGSAPGTVTVVVLGDTYLHPRSWLLFGCMLFISLALAFLIRRSTWAKRHLYKKREPMNFE